MAKKKSLSTQTLEQEIAELEAKQRGDQPDIQPDTEEVENVEQPKESDTSEAGKADTEPDTPPDEQDSAKDEPLGSEERTWKKRHGDLRRYSQKQIDSLKKELAELKEQSNTSAPLATEEEITEWIENNPKAAAVVQDLAKKMASKEFEDVQAKIDEFNELRDNMADIEQEAKILKQHPDFLETRDDEDFHKWLDKRSQRVQDMAFEGDADDVIEVFNLYKEAKGVQAKKDTKKAASDVKKSTSSTPTGKPGGKRWKESTVEAMSIDEYAKAEAEIDKAKSEGRFDYDLTAAAQG